MDKTITAHNHNTTPKTLFGVGDSKHETSWHYTSAVIKRRLHEKHVDEFFGTDFSAPPHKFSISTTVGSFFGVMIPTLFFAKKHNGASNLPLWKNLSKALDIDYGLTEILAVSTGGVVGGLLGGLTDDNERNKFQKIREASYQLMNISFPALLIGGAIAASKKVKALNNPIAKLLSAGVGLYLGIKSSVYCANKLEDRFFDKHNIDPDRKFKKKDFIVHLDDVFGALILAKIPLAEKLHISKILPLIYMWTGYRVGSKQDF